MLDLLDAFRVGGPIAFGTAVVKTLLIAFAQPPFESLFSAERKAFFAGRHPNAFDLLDRRQLNRRRRHFLDRTLRARRIKRRDIPATKYSTHLAIRRLMQGIRNGPGPGRATVGVPRQRRLTRNFYGVIRLTQLLANPARQKLWVGMHLLLDVGDLADQFLGRGLFGRNGRIEGSGRTGRNARHHSSPPYRI
ncbi:MAG: hypothetical protein EBQ78_00160 [Betaproteobacteria bacterium]|nr:hypothetical protein [Betaproteobacteria bacterium]